MATSPRPRTTWLWTERAAWAIAAIALSVWGIAALAGAIGARREMARFAGLQSAVAEAGFTEGAIAAPDLRPWSEVRVRAWKATYDKPGPPPLAVLRVPRLGIEVAVLEGTSDWVLNRGVGHIEGSAAVGSDGNAGIAGHRDGFFRGLKDIGPGDRIEIATPGAVQDYRVERTWIVKPEDVWVLDPTDSAAITLVTCYPFYFIGSAPQRFIVRAVRADSAPAATRKASL